MGNNPSTTAKPGTATSSSTVASTAASATSEPPRHSKRDSKSFPIPAAQRVAAPPEPSQIQAHGQTSNSRSKNLIASAGIAAGSSPSSSSNSSAVAPPKPPESRAIPRHEPSKPVDVPHSHSSQTDSFSLHAPYGAHVVEAPLVSHNSINDMSYLTRPPRLPLPIDEEIYTPGSPIIAPTDASDSLDQDVATLDSDGLTRKSSGISTATVEEEDLEELMVDRTQPMVPTKLEWHRGGDKVYVTGTIFQWNRKQRLHPVEGRPGVFAGNINILPGTHHVRFLVDGIMQTSPDLPTTVDFGNNLVNYIEVNADDVPPEQTGPSGEPVAVPATVQQDDLKTSPSQAQDMPPRGRSVPSPDQYQHEIPRYLVDFDQPEDSQAYQYASTAIDRLPNPPSLPGFLGKPILNAATLLKDDNSVLTMPNHTVLNHLATSSIKNNILAVSATTRYKNKYVTTIIYKPTTAED